MPLDYWLKYNITGGSPMVVDYCLKQEAHAGFVWTEDAANLLKTYENQRDQYPTFESFFPELVTFLNQYVNESTL